ncbi:MAG: hypothetical protein IJ087_00915 [Eggerthellaceae bacterium]|nr:hypothetical protein [Eggerthellaceae bacterium]
MKNSVGIIAAYLAVMLAVAGVISAIESVAFPDRAWAIEFFPAPKDRPILETVQQVRKARATGIAEFDFDGVHYIISGLPKEYVDYSAWYVRVS